MFFIHPNYLWLLLLLVPLAWQHQGHRTSLGAISLWSVATLRILAAMALVVALARPVLLREDPKQTIVHVIDVSAGVDQESLDAVIKSVEYVIKKEEKEKRHEVVLFAKRPWRIKSPVSVQTLKESIHNRDSQNVENQKSLAGSDLAAALDLAATCVREGASGEVRLYSDGRATMGNTVAAAKDLARKRLPLKTIVMGKPLEHELIVREVKAVATAMLGETVPVRATIQSTDPGVVWLVVSDESGEEVMRRNVSLSAGTQEIELTLPMTHPGTASFHLRVEGEQDTLTSNNQKPFAVEVLPAYRIGLIGTSEAAPLATLLGPSSEVQTISLESNSTESIPFDKFDLIVLADTPTEALGPDVVTQLAQAVKSGVGLLVTGGKRSFGPGGYLDGPLAELLPVRSVQKMEQRDPSATLVIIIDTSGSMGGARVQLAKEIARLAIQRLKPHDKAGIVEFYGSKRWAAPIQPASNAIDINRALNRLSAGGGTVILPAIEEAYFALLNVRTRTRHVLVLTDGGVETGAFEPLIRKMADSGITLSTVLVGPGSHSAFLTRLAQWGRGKSYHAPSRFNLPEILVKQPESSLLSPWIERPTQMVLADRSILTDAVDFNQAPLVTGYVETESRRTADVLIRSTLGHPILARWQYGLGHVATVTTQLAGPWSEELAKWDGYGPLTAGLTRSLARRTERMPIRLICTVGPEGLTILAKATTAASSINTASLELTAKNASDETVFHETLEPIVPGQWLTRVPLASLLASSTAMSDTSDTSEEDTLTDTSKDQVNEVVLRLEAATSAGLLASAAVAVSADDEFSSITPEKQEMANWEQACSRELKTMKEKRDKDPTFTTPSQAVFAVELRPRMIVLALVLFFAQVALRRLLPSRRFNGVTVPQSGVTSAAAILVLLAVITGTSVAAETVPNQPPVSPENAARKSETPVEPKAQDTALPQQPERKDLLPEKVIQQVQAAYKSGKPEEARSILLEATAKLDAGSPVKSHAARLAWICGDAKTASELFVPSGEEKEQCRDELLLGSLLLETDRPAQAIQHFQEAYQTATTSTDRRFAIALHLHAARHAKTLDKLANEWLAQEDLPLEQLRLLVQILGELDRHEEAFQLLERPGLSGDLSEDLQKDIVSLAIDAGKTDRATAIYRRLLEERPRHTPYLSAMARLYLLEDRREEAIRLFDDAIRSTDSSRSKDLFHLASAAADLALYDQARAALDRAAEASEEARITTVIKKADLARSEGNPDEAIKLLASLRTSVYDKPKQLLAVAEAYERYGDRVEAYTLLKRLYELTDSEDILAQVAWLSEESDRLGEAYDLWLKLWRQTKVAARQSQAKTRLLDLASRTGRLVDMVIEIEEKLDEGSATREEIMLLVDIYAQANDPISASEILYNFGQKFGGELEAAKRLVQVYVDCDLFARADAQLQRLIEMDPENAPEYLEQIAMLAVERGRPYEAFMAVESLNASKNASDHAAEFSAGVFELLGMYDEAIAAYDEVLAKQPDHIEILLLWGRVMKLANRSDEAVQRMLDIAKTSEKDDQFVIAIDGLLNLEAKPNVLREALELIERRLAADWDKVFLYDMAGDLLDNLGESDRKLRLLHQSLIAAGMRRPIVLRQLMDEAALNANDAAPNDLVIDYGQILLTLGDEVPPSVFLQIGKAMLDADDIKTAATIFRRAGVHGDFANIGRQVASLYEDSGKPQQAEALLHELLITEPDAIDLLIQAGGLSEQIGRFPRAFDSYLKAANRLLDRVPPVIRTQKKAEDAESTVKQEYYRREINLSELDLYLESATIGLIASARDDACQACVIEALTEQVEQELADLKTNQHLRPTLAENPRLTRRITLLRRIAFALHRPDSALRIDRTILAEYPEDKTLLPAISETYLGWGFIQSASTLVASSGNVSANDTSADAVSQTRSQPQTLTLYRLLQNEEARARFVADPKRSSVLAEKLIPMLFAKGHADDAKQLLAGLSTAQKRQATGYLAANVLDDQEALAAWAKSGTQQSFSNAKQAEAGFRRVAEMAWSSLDQAAREQLVQQIATTAESFEEDRYLLDLLRLELTVEGPIIAEVVKDEKLLERVLAQQARNAPELKRWLVAMAPEQRPTAIRAGLSAQPQENQRSYLLNLLCEVDSLDDPALFDLIVDLFKTSPKMKVTEEAAFAQLTRFPWYRLESPAGKAAAAKIAAQLLADHGPMTCVATLHAISTTRVPSPTADLLEPLAASGTSNKSEPGQAVMFKAIQRILGCKKLQYHSQRLLKELIDSLPASDVDALSTLLEKQIEQDGMTAPVAFAQAYLNERLGNTKENLDALRTTFTLDPSDMMTARGYIDTMQKLGRHAELAQTLSGNLREASIMQSYQWRTLADLYCELYCFEDAIRTAQKDDTPLAPIRTIGLETLRDNPDGALREIRRFFIKNRKDRRFYSPTWMSYISKEGLQGYLENPSVSTSILHRKQLFEGLADQPYAVDEWGTMLRAAEPTRRDVPDLVQGYADALRAAGKTDEALDIIRARQASGIANQKDRLLWLALQCDQEQKAAPTPEDQANRDPFPGLDEMLVSLDWTDRRAVTQLARTLLASGQTDEARYLLRWAIALGQWGRQNEFRYADAWDPIDLLVETYPEEEHTRRILALLNQLAPSPISGSSMVEFDAERFRRLLKLVGTGPEATQMLEQELLTYRQRLTRESSKPSRDALALLATLEASLDHFDAFRETVHQTLDTTPANLYRVGVWDYRSFLPPAAAMTEPAKYLAEVVTQIKQRKDQGQIQQAEYLRALCLLANWQVTNQVEETSLKSEVENVATRMESIGLFEVDPCTTLWLIDYYQQIGDTTATYELSKRLLENQTYPPARFPWLLDEIQKREGDASLQEMIQKAKAYSKHPLLYPSPVP